MDRVAATCGCDGDGGDARGLGTLQLSADVRRIF